MADPNESLDAEALRGLLHDLGRRVADVGAVAEVALYGGSALLFVLDARRATRDVDYVMLEGDAAALSAAAADVGRDAGLSGDWFNDAVSIFASDVPDYRLLGDFPPDRPGLRVFSASPEYLLALKLTALRSSLETSDASDAWHLLDACGVEDEPGALAVVERFFPGRPLPRRNALVLADMMEARSAGRSFSRELAW